MKFRALVFLFVLAYTTPASARICGDAVLRQTLAPDMYQLGQLLGQRYRHCHARIPKCGSRALKDILDRGTYERRCGP